MPESSKVTISIERLALGAMAVIILNFAAVTGIVGLLFVGVSIYLMVTKPYSQPEFAGDVLIGCTAFLAIYGAISISLWGARTFLDAQKRSIFWFSVLLFVGFLITCFVLTPDYVAITISIWALLVVVVRRKSIFT
jgi:hypothetical protein